MVSASASAEAVRGQEPLRVLAQSKARGIGAAVSPKYIRQADAVPRLYHDAVAREFNVLVADNDFKMSSLLRKRPLDPFRVRVSDLETKPIEKLAALAKANGGQKVRGHALIWHNQVPEWLKEESGSWSSAQLTAFATSYITAVLGYCKDRAPQIYEWDVFNEIIDGDPATWRTGTWYDGVACKQTFLDACFHAARKADPKVRLIYNDYRVELHNGSGRNAFLLEMVAGMVKRRVPIDGVGLQCHFMGPDANGAGGFTEKSAQAFAATFAKLHALGLDGVVTELDLRLKTDSETGEGKVTPKQRETQAKQYELVSYTALSQPNCPALLVWGVGDAHSWVPKMFPGFGHALLLDHSYQKKPAYEGVRRALHRLPGKK